MNYPSRLSQNAQSVERGVIPLYAQLVRILRTKLNAGEYKPGDAFPPEEELARTYEVSRITVREALRILADEGVIVRLSGKGTFVTKKTDPGALLVASSIEDLVYGGHQAETQRQYIGRKRLPANRAIAETLQIPLGTSVMEVRALVFVGENPFGYLRATLPYSLGRYLPQERLSEKPVILLLLELLGLQLGAVDQCITVSRADRDDAKFLCVKAGDPILVLERVFWDFDGAPIMMAVGHYHGDRFRHRVRLKRAAAMQERRRRLVRPIERASV